MPNIASVLKDEIARIARKELRAELDVLKKHSAEQRSRIADLRRQIETLSRQLKQASKLASVGSALSGSSTAGDSDDGVHRRFSPTRLANHRTKLGLSAADYGQLVGVAGQSIYNWEQGKSRPRAAQLEALAAVRGISKKEAEKRLVETA